MISNFLQIFLLISPVFILIILGNILRRIGVPDTSFWDVNDKLVYWVLIPALLYHHISQISLSSGMIYSYGIVILSGLIVVTVIAIFMGKALGYSPESWSSILQGAARHNAFIALAIAGSLFGDKGLEIGAVLMLIYVPSINIVVISIMVANLKQPGEADKSKGIANIFIELIKNPFILAMIAGLFVSLFESNNLIIIKETSGLLGSAALPIMLLTIGAKIKVRDLALKITPIVISNSLKLIVFPAIAFVSATYLGLSQLEIVVLVIFASVPTAASSHALAKQFGGDEQLMTSIVSTQVALSFITIPLILALVT